MTRDRPFGADLYTAVATRGPLCVGIDPHPQLLADWGLADDVAGLERFSLGVVEALADRVAVLKPQVAFFERHGSRGLAVLERVLAAAAQAAALTLVDAKRGDIGSTMAAYADAFVGDSSALAGDAVTVSPYLGFGSLRPLLDLAAVTGRGVFVLGLTSNPEGADVQLARGQDGRTVAEAVLDAVREENAGAVPLGSVGVVVGATLSPETVAGVGLAHGVNGPLLAPGIGPQGASAADLRAVFGPSRSSVLPTVSREVLSAGPDPDQLRKAFERTLSEVRHALGG